jgi:hypothetical protein
VHRCMPTHKVPQVQVERKFVMLMLGTPGVLVAMDPHAADERVRLEQLQVPLSRRKPDRCLAGVLIGFNFDMEFSGPSWQSAGM